MKSNCREKERSECKYRIQSIQRDDRKEHVRSQTKWKAKSVIWSGKDKRSRPVHNLQSLLLLFIRCYLAIWDSSQMISVLMSMSPAITMSTTGRSKMNCFVLRQLIKRSLQKLQCAKKAVVLYGYMDSLTTNGQTHHSFPRLRVHFARANHFSNRNMEKVPAAWHTQWEEKATALEP